MANLNTISYDGFTGTVNYSQEDGVFFGKIEGINGLVNFEGETVKKLETAFRSAVDDYKALCQEKGIEPLKQYSGMFNIRITPELHRQVASVAAKKRVSINKVVKTALDHYLEEAE